MRSFDENSDYGFQTEDVFQPELSAPEVPLHESEIMQIVQQVEPNAITQTNQSDEILNQQYFAEPQVFDYPEQLPQPTPLSNIDTPQSLKLAETIDEPFEIPLWGNDGIEPETPVTVLVTSAQGEQFKVTTNAANVQNVIDAAAIADQLTSDTSEMLPQQTTVENAFQLLPTTNEPEQVMRDNFDYYDNYNFLSRSRDQEQIPFSNQDALFQYTEPVPAYSTGAIMNDESPIDTNLEQFPKVINYVDKKTSEPVTVVVTSAQTGEQVKVTTTPENVQNVVNAAQVADTALAKDTATATTTATTTEDLLFGYPRESVYLVGAVAGIALLIGISSFGE